MAVISGLEPVPNARVYNALSAPYNTESKTVEDPRTELDSHANMAILGEYCYVFEW